jgi:hypothetical protein
MSIFCGDPLIGTARPAVNFACGHSERRPGPDQGFVTSKGRIALGMPDDPAAFCGTDVEAARKCIEETPFYYEMLSAELRSDRGLADIAVRACGEVLKFASEELQADLDLAILAVREPSRPLLPHMTSPAHLCNPRVCETLFPNALRWNDEWLLQKCGADTSEPRATHIPTRRCFPLRSRAILGIAPPPRLSVTTETTMNAQPIALSVDVHPQYGEDEWQILVEHIFGFDKQCKAFEIHLDSLGDIAHDGRHLAMARTTVAFAGKRAVWNRFLFDVAIEDTEITMTMCPCANKATDLCVLQRDFGFAPNYSVHIPLYETLGNRLQSELLFRRRLRLCNADVHAPFTHKQMSNC